MGRLGRPSVARGAFGKRVDNWIKGPRLPGAPCRLSDHGDGKCPGHLEGITTGEAAEILGVSVQTLNTWRQGWALPSKLACERIAARVPELKLPTDQERERYDGEKAKLEAERDRRREEREREAAAQAARKKLRVLKGKRADGTAHRS